MTRLNKRPYRWAIALVSAALLAGACTNSSADSGNPVPAGGAESVMVAPNLELEDFVINVVLTDEGFEPETIFIPAGQHIRLVLRNRSSHEHHYRIVGLVPSQVEWYMEPEFDDVDLEEFLAGLKSFEDAEHELHHLAPEYVPFREPSWRGIQPLKTEVHGYAQRGGVEIVTFHALNTGEFVVEDVAFPEITGRAIVYEIDS